MKQDESGCDVCRGELENSGHDHLINVFATDSFGGDLSGLQRLVIQAPTQLDEADGRVTYQNDFVYQCTACQAFWLQQYWEVDTPETAYDEFGHRYVRVLPLSLQQVALIRTTLEAGGKLPHNQFA
jgi:hypothetical protein